MELEMRPELLLLLRSSFGWHFPNGSILVVNEDRFNKVLVSHGRHRVGNGLVEVANVFETATDDPGSVESYPQLQTRMATSHPTECCFTAAIKGGREGRRRRRRRKKLNVRVTFVETKRQLDRNVTNGASMTWHSLTHSTRWTVSSSSSSSS